MNLPPPRPVYFGPAERACFGWLHAPAAGFVPSLGLVICPPFGFEEVCAHRSLRALAAAAASAGIPSLRVDLPGSGHSAGDEFQPRLWQAWQDGLGEAADALRAAFGVTRVVFLGVRLGATLAMLTSSRASCFWASGSVPRWPCSRRRHAPTPPAWWRSRRS